MADFQNENHGIVLFDGYCNYCSRWVNFIIRFDKKYFFQFATLQSDTAIKLVFENNNNYKIVPESVIFIEKGKMFFKSDAGLRILKNMNWPFPFFYPLIILPKILRDGIYDFIAKNRYRWFGKRKFCRMPETEEEKGRFLS